MPMKKVTFTLDEATADWARLQATIRSMSLSKFIGEVLRERTSRDYEEAYRGWREEKPFDLKGPWSPYPKREDLYDRSVDRRRLERK